LKNAWKVSIFILDKNNKGFTLTNSSKLSFFYYYHWQFLPINHKYRKNINDFFVGKVKRDVVSSIPSSAELYDVGHWIWFSLLTSCSFFFFIDKSLLTSSKERVFFFFPLSFDSYYICVHFLDQFLWWVKVLSYL
jgi:hypothetical protein